MRILAISLLALAACSPPSQEQAAVRGHDQANGMTEAAHEEPSMEKVVKTEEEWQEQLTPEQYRITRKKGTERAFTGKYAAHKDKGTYRCVCCGNELFSSDTKYDSGSGWPSFWSPIENSHVATEEDRSLFTTRTEVLCSRCDAHLGHVFGDGPQPTGQRYCINSGALDFEPEP